jgi:methylmalonyl-CoA/ethylmalonyl-CoA epimerase
MKGVALELPAFKKLHHVGVIVKDIDKAIAYLTSIGLGPFQGREGKPWSLAPFKGELHGKPGEWKAKISNAQIADIQLELLEPCGGESALQESLDDTGEGLHHLGYITDDVDRDTDIMVKQGLKIWTSARMAPGKGFVYFLPTEVGGIAIELRTL